MEADRGQGRWSGTRLCGSDRSGHLPGHCESHPQTHPVGGRSASRVAGDVGHRVPHLVLLVLLHVADRPHRGSRVDGLLDLGGKRHVDDHQLGDFQPVLVVDFLADLFPGCLRHLRIIGCQVECGDARLGHVFTEGLHDQAAEQSVDGRKIELFLRSGHLLEQRLGIDDLQRVASEGTDPNRAEVGVPQWQRVGGAPLEVSGLAGADEEDVALERALEPVFPALEGAEDRDVVGIEFVTAGVEDVGDLSFVDEDRLLPRPHDQLGVVLDLVVVSGEFPDQYLWFLVVPLDDIDQLALELVEETHGGCLRGV